MYVYMCVSFISVSHVSVCARGVFLPHTYSRVLLTYYFDSTPYLLSRPT